MVKHVLRPEMVTAETLVVLDNDGVLNANPFLKTWVGENPQPNYPHQDLWVKENWAMEPVLLDVEKHYLLQEIDLTEQGYPNRKLHVSAEILDNVRKLQLNPKIQVVFLSMWNTHIPIFCEATKIAIPYLPLESYGFSETEMTLKPRTLLNFLKETPTVEKLVWVDDMIFRDIYQKSPLLEHMVEGHPSYESGVKQQVKESLLVAPETQYGINREDWKQIHGFVTGS